MEDKDKFISELQEKIKAQDKDINLAATYGKQLIEEKSQLSARVQDLHFQIEQLEQDKHALQLDLETKVSALNSQTHDLEFLRDQADNFEENFKKCDKENEILTKKYDCLKKENQYLEKSQEDLKIENKSLKDKISILTKQLKNFEEQAEKSLCEAEESQDIQAQLSAYMINNKELLDTVSQMEREIENTKKNENRLLKEIQELEETLCERNAQISTFNSEMKAARDEIEDLQAEIESLKFDQIDVKKRGNSVFAELDDRRNLVEREYKVQREKFDIMQRNYEENKKELDRARGQVAYLQSMTTRKSQERYIDDLENSLSSARKEVKDLAFKLSKVVNDYSKSDEEKNKPAHSKYDCFLTMLKQSQKREKELQAEVATLKLEMMRVNENLTDTHRKLYKTAENLEAAHIEISNLKMKVHDLEQDITLKQPTEKTAVRKPRVEYLESYKSTRRDESKENATDFNSTLHPAPDIIPAKLTLAEDGQKQTVPSQKPNPLFLKQNDQNSQPLDRKDNSLRKSFYEEQNAKNSMNQARFSTRPKHESCAQQ